MAGQVQPPRATDRRGQGTGDAGLARAAHGGAAALFRLAGPMIASRAGLAAMGIADALMVARYSTREMAMVALAEGTFGRLVDICVAFTLSGLVLFAKTRRQTDRPERLALWRRMLAIALGLGLAGGCAAFFFEPLLRAMGQDPAMAASTASVIRILGLGLPGGLAAVACAVFLEGTRRAGTVARWIVAANVLNLALDWLLIGGHFSLPALGAAGSAIATSCTRLLLAAALVAEILREQKPWQTQGRPLQRARARDHLRLGFSASGTAGGMHLLGILLTVCAGLLGPLQLAAYASCWIINLPGMLLALGLGDAIALRVGQNRTALVAGDLTVMAGTVLLPAFAVSFGAPLIAGLYTSDPALGGLLRTLLPLSGTALACDALGIGLVSVLRGLKDIKGPAAIQLATMAATPALAATLAFWARDGVHGMVTAVAVTSTLRLALLSLRFGARLRVSSFTASAGVS